MLIYSAVYNGSIEDIFVWL